MKHTLSFTALILVIASGSSCDPVGRLGVYVVRDPVPTTQNFSGKREPVVNAKATLYCPDQEPETIASTSAGRFFYTTIPAVRFECFIEISEGKVSQRYNIEDLCLDKESWGCRNASLYAILPQP